MADILPTLHHLPIPWVMGYDIAPGETTKNKKSLLDFIYDNNLTMIFEHDPKYWGATIAKKKSKNGNIDYIPDQCFSTDDDIIELHFG